MDKDGPTAGFPCMRLSKWRNAAAMVQTVRKNVEGFAPEEAKKAALSRQVQTRLGCPSDREFDKMVMSPNIKTPP